MFMKFTCLKPVLAVFIVSKVELCKKVALVGPGLLQCYVT